MSKIDLTGQRFGSLKVLRETDLKSKTGQVYLQCKCKCGKIKNIRFDHLLSGATKSCGCLKLKRQRDFIVHNTHLGMIKSQKINLNNTSGIRGVFWDTYANKWRAAIGFQKKEYKLGRFDTIEEAAAVRKKAEEQLFGNFLAWYEEEIKKEKLWEKSQKELQLTNSLSN